MQQRLRTKGQICFLKELKLLLAAGGLHLEF
jgi:hypothetical protein